MKKIILSITAIAIFLTFKAESQVFRIGTGVGIGEKGANFNIVEVGYASSTRTEFGGYFGLAVDSSIDKNVPLDNIPYGTRYGLHCKHYFGERGFKPYLGFQIGLATLT